MADLTEPLEDLAERRASQAPVLADVFSALECHNRDATTDITSVIEFACVAGDWIDANRTALERFEWERQARAHCDAAGTTPVIERYGDVAPCLGSHRIEIGGNGIWFAAVFAGRDWKPEVTNG